VYIYHIFLIHSSIGGHLSRLPNFFHMQWVRLEVSQWRLLCKRHERIQGTTGTVMIIQRRGHADVDQAVPTDMERCGPVCQVCLSCNDVDLIMRRRGRI
jgi:MOSC domain-containing protein YiiM